MVLGEGSGCDEETKLNTRERFIPLLLDKYKVMIYMENIAH